MSFTPRFLSEGDRSTAYVALCIWEHHLEHVDSETHPISVYRSQQGVNEARELTLKLAPVVDVIWNMTDEDRRDEMCFDWEFVPALLNLMWREGTCITGPISQETMQRLAIKMSA